MWSSSRMSYNIRERGTSYCLVRSPYRPTKRKVHLWKRADTIQMRDGLCSFANNFITTYDVTSNIEEMWRNITSSLSHILDKCVPSKMTTTRFNQPWITREVKRLSRQKKRCFKKARDSKSSKEQRRYQHLKRQLDLPVNVHMMTISQISSHLTVNPILRNFGVSSPVKGQKVQVLHR